MAAPGREQGGGGGTPIVDDALVARVRDSILEQPLIRHLGADVLPRTEAVGELVDTLRDLVFPGFFRWRGLTEENLGGHVQELLARAGVALEDQIASVLRYEHDLSHDRAARTQDGSMVRRARESARAMLEQIPEIRRKMALDVQAAYDGDPAARHTDETIFCYPGIDAVFSHRVSHALMLLGVPMLPRLIQEMAHSRTGIDIHPGALIGESFFIDHGGGVVIGETSVIGNSVRIYQGVTLGAKSFEIDERGRLMRTGRKRHPTIGDRVTIYAGAVILGGDTVIGDDCVVSGSVFVTESVPPGHLVRHDRLELVLRSNVKKGGESVGEIEAGG